MNDLKLLRVLIREIAGPFDMHAFSDERQALPNPPPPEPNNAAETAILEKILAAINEEEKLDERSARLLSSVLRGGLYQDFIQRPDDELVFRGMSVYPNELRQMGITEIPSIGEKLEVSGDFSFKPRGGSSSSWTTNRRIASLFSRFKPNATEKQSHKIEIVMTASTLRNPYSFISLLPFYPMMFSYGYEEESEVMGLGEIAFEKLEMKRTSER